MSRGLLPLDEARRQLLAGVSALPGREMLPLGEALGRILAEVQVAALDMPPWDNSAMDGYAVRSADARRELPEAARFAAGDAPGRLDEDTVARIFTGAPLPEGADAVVMQEDVDTSAGRVSLPAHIQPGQHVRPRGQECRRGEALLASGRRLRPQDIGLLASQGVARVPVVSRLRVALLSTGSELREPGTELLPGEIYNSNRAMLSALLRALGCSVRDCGNAEDDARRTREMLAEAAMDADLVLTSGGVSVGEADHVRAAVEDLGALYLWRIAIKPGKPFSHGEIRGTPFIGLPGNPASAFVTFLLLARPWIERRQGRRDERPRFYARAGFDHERPGTREEYVRVQLGPVSSAGDAARLDAPDRSGLWASLYPNQSSGILRSVVGSDALARIPIGRTVGRGDLLEVFPLDLYLS
jgi:molybdopterin molybdotransferase